MSTVLSLTSSSSSSEEESGGEEYVTPPRSEAEVEAEEYVTPPRILARKNTNSKASGQRRLTKYNKVWETEFDFIREVTTDKHSAKCIICSKVFKISGSGIGQIKIHASTLKHNSIKSSQLGLKSQSRFIQSGGTIQLSNGKLNN